MQDRVFTNMQNRGINPFSYMSKMGFTNAYLNDKEYTRDNSLFLLFNHKIDEDFKSFSEMCLELHEDYISNYDVDENKVMYIFEIPKEYVQDVSLIYQGKYSMTSSKFKALFPNKIYNKEGKEVFHANWMILHKHPQWKKEMETRLSVNIPNENELWDAFNDENEIFNYNVKINEAV